MKMAILLAMMSQAAMTDTDVIALGERAEEMNSYVDSVVRVRGGERTACESQWDAVRRLMAFDFGGNGSVPLPDPACLREDMVPLGLFSWREARRARGRITPMVLWEMNQRWKALEDLERIMEVDQQRTAMERLFCAEDPLDVSWLAERKLADPVDFCNTTFSIDG